MDKKQQLFEFLQSKGYYTDTDFNTFSSRLNDEKFSSSLYDGLKRRKLVSDEFESYDSFASYLDIKKKSLSGEESGVGLQTGGDQFTAQRRQPIQETPEATEEILPTQEPVPGEPVMPGRPVAYRPGQEELLAEQRRLLADKQREEQAAKQKAEQQLQQQRAVVGQAPLVLTPEQRAAEETRQQQLVAPERLTGFTTPEEIERQQAVNVLRQAREERKTPASEAMRERPTGENIGTAYGEKREKRPIFGPSGDIIGFSDSPAGPATMRERTLNTGLKLSEAYTLLKLKGEIPESTSMDFFVQKYSGKPELLSELDKRVSEIQKQKEQEKIDIATKQQEEYASGVQLAKRTLETTTGKAYTDEQVRKMLEDQFGIYAPGAEPVEKMDPEKLKIPAQNKSNRWTSGISAGAKVVLPGIMSTLRQATLIPEFVMDTYTDILADRDGEITRLISLREKGLVDPEVVKDIYDKRKEAAKAVLNVNSLLNPALLGFKATNALQEEIGTKERAARAKQRFEEANAIMQASLSDEKSADLLKQGRYKDFFIKTSADAVASVPSFAISMIPVAGQAIMGASTMKSKYDDIKEQYGDVMTAEGVTNAVVTGTLDGIGARFTASIGKVAADLARKVGTTAAKRTMGAIVTDIAKKAGGATITEGGEEAMVKLAENIVDKATINPDQDLGEGVLESAAAGAFLGPVPVALGGGVRIARFRNDQKEYNKQLLLNAIDVMTKSHQAFYDTKDTGDGSINETIDAYLSGLAGEIVKRSNGKYDEKSVLKSPEYLAIANNRNDVFDSMSKALGVGESFTQMSEAEKAFKNFLDSYTSTGAVTIRDNEDVESALQQFYKTLGDRERTLAAREENRLRLFGRAFASQKQEQNATEKIEDLQPEGGQLQPVGTEEGQQVQVTGQEAQPGADAGNIPPVSGVQEGEGQPIEGVTPTEGKPVQPAEGITPPITPIVTPTEQGTAPQPTAEMPAPDLISDRGIFTINSYGFKGLQDPGDKDKLNKKGAGIVKDLRLSGPSERIVNNRDKVWERWRNPDRPLLYLIKDEDNGKTYMVAAMGWMQYGDESGRDGTVFGSIEYNEGMGNDVKRALLDETYKRYLDADSLTPVGNRTRFLRAQKGGQYKDYNRVYDPNMPLSEIDLTGTYQPDAFEGAAPTGEATAPGATMTTPTEPVIAPKEPGVTSVTAPALTGVAPAEPGAEPVAPSTAPETIPEEPGVAPAEEPVRVTKTFSEYAIDGGDNDGKIVKVIQTSYIETVEGSDVIVTEYDSSLDGRQAIIGGREMTVGQFKEEFPIPSNGLAGLKDEQIITVLKVNRTKPGSKVSSTVEIFPYEALTIERFRYLMKLNYDQYRRRFGSNKKAFDEAIGKNWLMAMKLVQDGTIKIYLESKKLYYEIPESITGELRDGIESLIKITTSGTDINPMTVAMEQSDEDYAAALADLTSETEPIGVTTAPTAPPVVTPTTPVAAPQQPITGTKKVDTISGYLLGTPNDVKALGVTENTFDEVWDEFQDETYKEVSVTSNTLREKKLDKDQAKKIYNESLRMAKVLSRFGINVYITGNIQAEHPWGLSTTRGFQMGDEGMYISITNGTISTVSHEAFHALMYNLTKTPGPASVTVKLFKDISKIVFANPDTRDTYNTIVSWISRAGYASHKRPEEFLAQLIGYISEGIAKKPVDKSILGRIEKAINDFLEDILGKDVLVIRFTDSGDLLDFINSVSDGFKYGDMSQLERAIELYESGRLENPRKTIYFKKQEIVNGDKYVKNVLNALRKMQKDGTGDVKGLQRVINNILKKAFGDTGLQIELNTVRDAHNFITSAALKIKFNGKNLKVINSDLLADIVIAINDFLSGNGVNAQNEFDIVNTVPGLDEANKTINNALLKPDDLNPDLTTSNQRKELADSAIAVYNNIEKARQKLEYITVNKKKYEQQRSKAAVASSIFLSSGMHPSMTTMLTGWTSDINGYPKVAMDMPGVRVRKMPDQQANQRLSEFIKHPDFFNYFPEAANYLLKYDSNLADGDAEVDLDEKIIRVGNMPSEQVFKASILNEMRYIGQDAELFASGGLPQGGLYAQEYFDSIRNEAASKVDRAQKRLDDAKKVKGMPAEYIKQMQDNLDLARTNYQQAAVVNDRSSYFEYVRNAPGVPMAIGDMLSMDPMDRMIMLQIQNNQEVNVNASLEVTDTEQFVTQSQNRKADIVFEETKFISVQNAVNKLLSIDRSYLKPVLDSIHAMRKRTRNGELKPSDVAKAWLMSIASQGSSAKPIETVAENLKKYKINMTLDGTAFVESYKSGDKIIQSGVRPEAMAAAILSSSIGKDFLRKLDEGSVDADFIDGVFIPAISVFGLGDSKRNAILIPTDKKKSIYQIFEVTDKLNEIGKKGPAFNNEFYNELQSLNKISVGKMGFMGQFLGISDIGVVDKRQMKFWIDNGGDSAKSISEKLQLEILSRISQVAAQLSTNEDPITGEDAYIAHHLIWDAVDGVQVAHEGLYKMMLNTAAEIEITVGDSDIAFDLSEDSIPPNVSPTVLENPNYKAAVRFVNDYADQLTTTTAHGPYVTDHEVARSLINQFGFSPYDARQLIEAATGRKYRAAHPMTVDADASEKALWHYFATSLRSGLFTKTGRQQFRKFAYALDLYTGNMLAGIRDLQRQLNKQASSDENAYADLQTMRSRAAYKVMLFRDKFMGDPDSVSSKRDSFIGRVAKELGSEEAFNEFLIAQHQEERYDRVINKQLKKIVDIMKAISDKELSAEEQRMMKDILDKALEKGDYNSSFIAGKIITIEEGLKKLEKKSNAYRSKLANEITRLNELKDKRQKSTEYRKMIFDKLGDQKLEKARQFYKEFKRDYLDAMVELLLDGGVIDAKRASHLINGTIDDDPATYIAHDPTDPGYRSVAWSNYVPLLIEESAYADEMGYFQSPLNGIPDSSRYDTIANPGIKKLKGTTRFGEEDIQNVLHVTFARLTKAAYLSEQNKSRQTLARLLTNYPSQQIAIDQKGNTVPRYQIITSMAIPKVNEFGEVVGVDDFTPEQVKKQSLQFRDANGKLKYIYFSNPNDPALLGLKTQQETPDPVAGPILRAILNLTNVYRGLITQFSPTFIISNPFRDVQDVFLSIDMEGKEINKNAKSLKLKYSKNLAQTIAFFSGNTYLGKAMGVDGVPTAEWRKKVYDAWKEMQENGGRMSWSMLGTNPTESMEKLQQSIIDAEKAGKSGEGLVGQLAYRGKNPKFLLTDALTQLTKMSDFTESMNRLAAYMTMRESGLSPREAAAVAKNITINFEKKGIGRMVNTGNHLYLFLNVGIQGARRFAKLLSKKEGLKSVAAMISVSALNRMLLYSLIDDEDEEQNVMKYVYNDYAGRNKTLVPNPFNKDVPIMIPKPYGMARMAYTIGEGIVDVVLEKKSVGDVTLDLSADLLTAVDPIAGGGNAMVNYMPFSVAHPIFSAAMNQDWMGNQILREYGFESSLSMNYTKAYKNTPEWAKNAAEWMATEAPIFRVDMSPVKLEYLVNEYTSLGPLKFFDNYEATRKGIEEAGKELGITDIAMTSLVRPLYRPDISESAKNDMFTLMDMVRQKPKTAPGILGGIPEGKKEFMKNAMENIRKENLLKPKEIKSIKKVLRDKYPDESNFIDSL